MDIKKLNEALKSFIEEEEPKQEIPQEELEKSLKDKSGEAEQLLKDKDKLDKSLTEFQEKTKELELGDYLKYIPLLVGMVYDFVSGKYKDAPVATIISIVCCVIYLVSPVDLIPDVTPVVGFLDDIGVIKLTIDAVKSDIDKYEEWKKSNELS